MSAPYRSNQLQPEASTSSDPFPSASPTYSPRSRPRDVPPARIDIHSSNAYTVNANRVKGSTSQVHNNGPSSPLRDDSNRGGGGGGGRSRGNSSSSMMVEERRQSTSGLDDNFTSNGQHYASGRIASGSANRLPPISTHLHSANSSTSQAERNNSQPTYRPHPPSAYPNSPPANGRPTETTAVSRHSPNNRPVSVLNPSASSSSSNPQHGNDGTLEVKNRQRSRTLQREENRSGSGEPRSGGQPCDKCELPMSGQFVRALGAVYHLDCFRCQDCNKVVASKFFPVDIPDGDGKQYPLCETDYFRRLGLLCFKCGSALRGSYITALNMKFHVEHFTCSVCPTVFGPQDSYYEYSGSIYCHFHYSTRFAVNCTGCRTAILKQFVEINRNSIDEHWHPECYMIHKFWNIKLAMSTTTPPRTSIDINPSISAPTTTEGPQQGIEVADYVKQEELETPLSLKTRQKLMEEQVYRIWTVLSAFEESSAACISEMLRHVSSGQYIEAVRMAEKFVRHVETLFSAIDDLSVQYKQAGAKDISHVREARMLCKKVVSFFALLSHTHETGARKMSITQDLLSLVTGLAHYLKILIRIALTAALKLEREYHNITAIGSFLNKLNKLAKDPEAGKLSPPSQNNSSRANAALGTSSNKARSYGYKSLNKAVGVIVGQVGATTDLCEGCKLTVEEESARMETSLRWHLPCLRCIKCGRPASKDPEPGPPEPGELQGVYLRKLRMIPPTTARPGIETYCCDCAPNAAVEGFEYVTRLEQYAFLLCVALNKLYALLTKRGVVNSRRDGNDETSPIEAGEQTLYDTYRDSTDIKRMKSVNLDRKLSSTRARRPQRSTVIQSPSGRVAQPHETSGPLPGAKPPVPSRKDQPLVDPSGAVVPRPPVPVLPPALRSSGVAESRGREESPSRPVYDRQTTATKIVDEQAPEHAQSPSEGPVLGGLSEPTQDEDGITLADVPKVVEAERAKQHRQHASPRAGALLSELSALEYFIIKHAAALVLSENAAIRELVSLDDLMDIIDAKKNNFWGKFFKGNNDKKSVKKRGVFGIPLDVLVERNGADSMHGAGPGSLRIPSFVDDVISAMKQMDMSVEGIFRKNGNIRRLKDLCEALDRDSAGSLSDENPVQLAALLKRFLRDLPDPLMTFKLFSLFIATQRVEDPLERRNVMHLVCCLLPKCHRDTMEAVFVFLKWVASFSHVDEETGSKMDLQNLATVICPNILYSKGKDPYKDESFSAVRTVSELLESQDCFWQVPSEFGSILDDQDLFSNPSQLTSKEILAKAEDYVRYAKVPRRNGTSQSTTTRGEVHPQRPDFQQAYSSPALPSHDQSGGLPWSNLSERPKSMIPPGHGMSNGIGAGANLGRPNQANSTAGHSTLPNVTPSVGGTQTTSYYPQQTFYRPLTNPIRKGSTGDSEQ